MWQARVRKGCGFTRVAPIHQMQQRLVLARPITATQDQSERMPFCQADERQPKSAPVSLGERRVDQRTEKLLIVLLDCKVRQIDLS